MIIPEVPEKISMDQLRQVHEILGIPFSGGIKELRIVPRSVEVTFFRHAAEADSSGHPKILRGSRESLAVVTVPIFIEAPDAD